MAVDCAEIGRRIRYHRIENKLSQEELAEMVELSSIHISHLERGRRMPSVEAIVNIANALNISADELLSESLLVSNSPDNARELELLYDCSPEEKSFILECMFSFKAILKRYKIRR